MDPTTPYGILPTTPAASAATNPDLDEAISDIKSRLRRYTRYQQYYDGEQPLFFATDKFRNAFGGLFREFAYNVCPMVVDALADRLTVTGFDVEAGGEQAGTDAWDIWQQNRMDQRQGEVYQEAAQEGDGYVLVWPSPTDETQPVIYPQPARTTSVHYNDDIPGLIDWAAKAWVTSDGYKRVNLYYKDRIEKYTTPLPSRENAALPDKASGLVPYLEDGQAVWPIPNPYGYVPVFHFANNAPVGAYGRSELHNVIPVQNALNKAYMDMLVSMEFNAFPQRWATGIEADIDEATGKAIAPFVPGADRLWTVGDSAARFGEFSQGNLDGFLKVADNFQLGIARISGTPLQYMMLMTNPPSGEALKTLEAKFIKKVRDRQATWGNVWENVLVFALQIAGKSTTDVRLSAQWENAAPTSDAETARTLVDLRKAGLGRRERLMRLGYKGQALEDAMAEQDDATPGGFGATGA